MTTTVALAGCTGSIGTQTLDVVRAEPDRFRVVALGASGRNPEAVAAQAVEVGAAVVAIDDEAGAAALKELLPTASPGSASRWPRSSPASGWHWPTRSRSSRPGPWCSGRAARPAPS